MSRSVSTIVCETAAGSGANVDVVANTGGQDLTCTGCYSFSAADTVTVTSFTPATPFAGGKLLFLCIIIIESLSCYDAFHINIIYRKQITVLMIGLERVHETI